MAGSDDKGSKKKAPQLRSLAEILSERRSRVAVPIPDEDDAPAAPERVSTPPPLPAGAEPPELMAGLHDSTEEFTGEIDLLALSAPPQPAGTMPARQDAGDQKSTEDFTGEVEVVEAPPAEPEPPATINVSRRLYYVLIGLAGAGSLVIAVNIVMLVVMGIGSRTSSDEDVLSQAEPGPAIEEPPPPVMEPEPAASMPPPPEPAPVVEAPPPAAPAPALEAPPPPEPAPVVEEPPPPAVPAPVVEKPVEKPIEKPAVVKPRPKKAKKKPAPVAAPPAEKKPKPVATPPVEKKPAPAPEPKPVEKPKDPSKWELLI